MNETIMYGFVLPDTSVVIGEVLDPNPERKVDINFLREASFVTLKNPILTMLVPDPAQSGGMRTATLMYQPLKDDKTVQFNVGECITFYKVNSEVAEACVKMAMETSAADAGLVLPQGSITN